MAGDNASGDKRKQQWKSDDRDGGPKRYKGALGQASAAKGSGGILVTCDKTKERQSVRDALNVLNEAADKYFPDTKAATQQAAADADATDATASGGGDNKTSTADTVQKKLQDEINALKADAKQRKTGRFTALDTGVKGVILIQILDPEVSARALVRKIFEDVDATKEFASRFINRMIPLEKLGHSTREEVKELAQPMIAEQLAAHADEHKRVHGADADVPPLEYAVEIKRRNCTHLKSMDVINDLAALVGPEQKVNLTEPKAVILVEVFRNTFGVSVVTNFHTYKKFNVRSILEPPVKGDAKAAKDGAKATVKDSEGAKDSEAPSADAKADADE